ncbi:MAG: peptidylprolyl isomerase [Pseudomonadota bacterium]
MFIADTNDTNMKFTTIFRDPLTYFLLVGALLFIASTMFETNPQKQIVFTKADQIALLQKWQNDFDRPPTQEEFDVLVKRWVREELALKEALAMELDQDDPVIRRRLIQKLEYITGEQAIQNITNDDLLTFYKADPSRYTVPETLTFTHYFFSNDRRATPKDDAHAALIQISSGATVVGDPFIQQRNHYDKTYQQISEVFGPQFADKLFDVAAKQSAGRGITTQWDGPFESSFGYHLVQLQAYDPGRTETFEEARERVLIDYQATWKGKAKDDLFDRLVAEYELVVE